EDGAARRLRRMRGEHELQRDRPGLRLAELVECGGERLARHPALARVFPPAPDAVVLLGDVREREVERERPEHACLALERKRLDRVTQLLPAGPLPGGPRERAHVLHVGEEALVLLLDEYAAEQVAEQADVAADGFHRSSVA